MRGVRQYQNKGNESDGDHFNGCLTFVSYAYFKVYTSTSNCFYRNDVDEDCSNVNNGNRFVRRSKKMNQKTTEKFKKGTVSVTMRQTMGLI